MNDQDLRRALVAATETDDEPSDEFVVGLRERLDAELQQAPQTGEPSEITDFTDRHGGIMALDLGKPTSEDTTDPRRTNRRLIMMAVAAGVVIVVGLTALFRAGDGNRTVSTADDPTTSVTTASTTEGDAAPAPQPLPTDPLEVGEAWLQSILHGDRETFVALHDPKFTAGDTLMLGSVSIVTRDKIPGVYFDGFDANAAYWATGPYPIESGGCEEMFNGDISCSFTELLLGDPDKIGTTEGNLTIVDGLITDVRLFGSGTPDNLWGLFPLFLGTEATPQDQECAAIGFNSIACGEHHADMLRRYFDYREEQLG